MTSKYVSKPKKRTVKVVSKLEIESRLVNFNKDDILVGVFDGVFNAQQVFAIALLRDRDTSIYVHRTSDKNMLHTIGMYGGYVIGIDGIDTSNSKKHICFNPKEPAFKDMFFEGTYVKLNRYKMEILQSIYKNTIGENSIDIVTSMINCFNITHEEDSRRQDLNFETAVHMAYYILGTAGRFIQIAKHKHKHEQAHKAYAAITYAAIKKKLSDKSYIILEKEVQFEPYIQEYNKEMKNNYVKKINFVIYPYKNRSRWIVHAIKGTQLDPIIKHLDGFKHLTSDNMAAEFLLLDQCTDAIKLTEAILYNRNLHVDTQRMIDTLRDSSPDYTTKRFLKIIMEHNIEKEKQ